MSGGSDGVRTSIVDLVRKGLDVDSTYCKFSITLITFEEVKVSPKQVRSSPLGPDAKAGTMMSGQRSKNLQRTLSTPGAAWRLQPAWYH